MLNHLLEKFKPKLFKKLISGEFINFIENHLDVLFNQSLKPTTNNQQDLSQNSTNKKQTPSQSPPTELPQEEHVLPETSTDIQNIIYKNPDIDYSDKDTIPGPPHQWKWRIEYGEWMPVGYRLYDYVSWIRESRGRKKKPIAPIDYNKIEGIMLKDLHIDYSKKENPPGPLNKWKWNEKHKQWIPIGYKINDNVSWILESRGRKKKPIAPMNNEKIEEN